MAVLGRLFYETRIIYRAWNLDFFRDVLLPTHGVLCYICIYLGIVTALIKDDPDTDISCVRARVTEHMTR